MASAQRSRPATPSSDPDITADRKPGDGSATAAIEEDRQQMLSWKLTALTLPCLEVRIRDPAHGAGERTVKVANLLPDSLGESVLRELAYCHPTYEFWTTEDGERIPMSRVLAIRDAKGAEKPLVSLAEGPPAPFAPLRMRNAHNGQEIEIANIPATRTGLSLMRRLATRDEAKYRKLYRTCDLRYFIAGIPGVRSPEHGWVPIRQLDVAGLFSDEDKPHDTAIPPEEYADGNDYETAPTPSPSDLRISSALVRTSKTRLRFNHRGR